MTDKTRIPPGQHVTRGFPVLHNGDVTLIDRAKWRLSVFGLVEEVLNLDFESLERLPHSQIISDIHCVTGWSKLDTT